jgi:hypothetical protein
MRKHIILFFSALLFLFACNMGNNTKGIIKEDEMVRLLTDIHIVDGSLYLQPMGDSLYKYGTGRYLLLFKQYHTDSAQFKRSMKYYTTQTDILMGMYDQVKKNLQIKIDSLNKVIAAETVKKAAEEKKARDKAAKQKADSIKKIQLKNPPVNKAAEEKKARDKATKRRVDSIKKIRLKNLPANKATGVDPKNKDKNVIPGK